MWECIGTAAGAIAAIIIAYLEYKRRKNKNGKGKTQ